MERCLKIEDNVLNLLEHKILNRRFVGIYRYEKNTGLFSQVIRKNDLTSFDIYGYMISLVNLTELVLQGRDRKNPHLIVNLNPSNILVLSSGSVKLKLVRVLPKSEEDWAFLSVPEQKSKKRFVDTRSRMKFNLGKVFFLLCFGEVAQDTREMMDTLTSLLDDPEPGTELPVDPKVLHLIRRLLNHSPIDRPSFKHLKSTLSELLSDSSFWLFNLKKWVLSSYNYMVSEIHIELFNGNLLENDYFDTLTQNNYDLEQTTQRMIEHEGVDSFSNVLDSEMMKGLMFKLLNVECKKDKFGMVKDFMLEDVLDDYSREHVMQDRLVHYHKNYNDLRDRLESFIIRNPDMDFRGETVGNRKVEDINRLITKNYLFFIDEQHSDFPDHQNEHAFEAHSEEHEDQHSFPLMYILIIVVCPIFVLLFSFSLIFKQGQRSMWKKSDFHAFLEFK